MKGRKKAPASWRSIGSKEYFHRRRNFGIVFLKLYRELSLDFQLLHWHAQVLVVGDMEEPRGILQFELGHQQAGQPTKSTDLGTCQQINNINKHLVCLTSKISTSYCKSKASSRVDTGSWIPICDADASEADQTEHKANE